MNQTDTNQTPAPLGALENPYRGCHGTAIAVGRIRASIGTSAGYAMEYGEDPSTTVARHVARGHETVWANAEATVISDPPTRDVPRIRLAAGDHIRIEGRTFKVTLPCLSAGDGDDPRLVDVTPAEVSRDLMPAITVTAERGPRRLQVTGRWPTPTPPDE